MTLATRMKEMVKSFIGPIALGFIDYFRFPEKRKSWGGPLNGQAGRQAIIEEILNEFKFPTIVETGTYRGTTTKYFAGLGASKIYTVEADDRNYGFSLASLLFVPRVKLLRDDSRQALRGRLIQKINASMEVFFYLDAHWHDDLPLKDELEIIFSQWGNAVVCIDDFKVSGDSGYAFDDYGPGKTLELEEIEPIIKKHQLAVFFPLLPSSQETGAKRGCVILAKHGKMANRLNSLNGIRNH